MPRSPCSNVRFDLLACGVVAIDEILYVRRFPGPDEKVRVVSRHPSCGGLAGTALVTAARLGAKVGFIGTLGTDDLSKPVTENFEAEGIDFALAPVREDASPGRSTIVVDIETGTRNVFSFVQGHFGPDPLRPDHSIIEQTRVLLVDHHEPAATLRLAKMARELGVPIVADFERDPSDRDTSGKFHPLLDMIDHLIVPERFALESTGASSPIGAIDRLWNDRRATVVVTSGDQGGWYRSADNEKTLHYEPFSVDVVDTTGCGDIFHGAYCVGLARGLAIEERLRLASATSAISAGGKGTQTSIPSGEDVRRFLQKNG
jgi:sulfofructose kinase